MDKVNNCNNVLEDFYKFLEILVKDKLSTNKTDPDQFLWEIHNKLFTIIISCQNSLKLKDSLAIHLVARYTYEMLIVLLYVVTNENKINDRAAQFLKFRQFKSKDRSWIGNRSFSDLLEDIPEKSWSNTHKTFYRELSNFSHPTIDSFLLNRRGQESEFLMILNTIALTLQIMIEMIHVCCRNKLFFKNEDIDNIMGRLNEFSLRSGNLT